MATVSNLDELEERKDELRGEIEEASERIQELEDNVLPSVILGEDDEHTEAEVTDEISRLQSEITAREKAIERLENNVKPELERQDAEERIEEIEQELAKVKREHDNAKEDVEDARQEFLETAKTVLEALGKVRSLRQEAESLAQEHGLDAPEYPEVTGQTADLREKLILGTKQQLQDYT
jgi:chromosome segregation ATPase